MTKQKVLAIIPARGGSKSVPLKNIADLGGKPLIAHSIQSALDTISIDRVIVSTDSPQIQKESLTYGAEVPFLRPANISEANTPDLPVFIHCISWLEHNEAYVPDLIVHLRPTTPFRDVSILEECILKLGSDPHADSLRVITPSKEHPYKTWSEPKHGSYLKPIIESQIIEPFNQPRQQLPRAYYQPGYVDVIRTTTITDLNSMTGINIIGHILDSTTVLDIDDYQSLLFARYLYSNSETIS